MKPHRLFEQLEVLVSLLFGGLFLRWKRVVDVNRRGVCIKQNLVVVNRGADKAGWLVGSIVECMQRIDRRNHGIPRTTTYPLFLAVFINPQEVCVSRNYGPLYDRIRFGSFVIYLIHRRPIVSAEVLLNSF